MERVCAWCGKVLGYRKGGAKGDITHGMCKACKAKYLTLGYRQSAVKSSYLLGDMTLRWVGAETKKEG